MSKQPRFYPVDVVQETLSKMASINEQAINALEASEKENAELREQVKAAKSVQPGENEIVLQKVASAEAVEVVRNAVDGLVKAGFAREDESAELVELLSGPSRHQASMAVIEKIASSFEPKEQVADVVEETKNHPITKKASTEPATETPRVPDSQFKADLMGSSDPWKYLESQEG